MPDYYAGAVVVAKGRGFEWLVKPLPAGRMDRVKRGRWSVRTDCRLLKRPAGSNKKPARVPLTLLQHGNRADLWVRSSIPGIGADVLWHRLVAYAFHRKFATYPPHDEYVAAHKGDMWWYVRRSGVSWKTQGENAVEQGKAGLIGPNSSGQRRRTIPPWAGPESAR